ncbi:MAG: hypothetical protein K0B09_06365 [Bacteroidales bacterium]|nr:hypothetical protein [Bacteroidales bacterium]
MRYKYLIVSGIVLLFFISSCIEDDLNKPVRVDVEFLLEENPLTITYLDFTNAVVALDMVRFYGIRQVGNDVFFTSRPGFSFGTFVIPAHQNSRNVTYFDVPQGIYSMIRWDAELTEINENVYDDELVDSDDFGLIFEGTYTRLDGSSVLLFIAVDPSVLSFETLNAAGNNVISLESKNKYTVSFELNPYLAMQGISRSLLEQAETDSEDDIEFIEISSDENEELFELVLFRLEKTFKAVIR